MLYCIRTCLIEIDVFNAIAAESFVILYLFISCALAHATGAAMMLMESGLHMIYTALDSLSLI